MADSWFEATSPTGRTKLVLSAQACECWRESRPTNYAIDLYQKLFHRPVGRIACPVHRRGVSADARQRNIGRVRDIDAQDIDQLRDGLP